MSCKLFDAALGKENGSPGMVVSMNDDSFSIATGDGSITVYSAQITGQKKQQALAFVQQIELKVGDQFGT
jgi:methionyl-tRNA formyltransferase